MLIDHHFDSQSNALSKSQQMSLTKAEVFSGEAIKVSKAANLRNLHYKGDVI